MLSIEATSIEELDQIDTKIHDWWFDLDRITYQPHTSVVTIPFDDAVTLEIFGVVRLSIEDTQRINRYDFNRFRYDNKRSILTIETGIPMIFQIYINNLHVRLGKIP